MANYLWGLHEGVWHALLVHDPEYIFEDSISESATRKMGRPMFVRRVAETKPGTAHTLCGLGAGRIIDPVTRIVVRDGVKLDAIGVDPEDGDSLCPGCVALDK